MKKKRIILSLISVAVLYLTGYAVSRIKHELIHRRTWEGGWNRHWVVSGDPEPSIHPLPFAPLHIPGEPGYNAAMDRFTSEYKAISRRRSALGVLFFPLRCLESLAWWIVNPKEDELDQQGVALQPGISSSITFSPPSQPRRWACV
jgi:hypothetical protein